MFKYFHCNSVITCILDVWNVNHCKFILIKLFKMWQFIFKQQCCIPCLLVHIWQAFFTDFAASRTRLSETYELIPIVRNYIIYSAKSINSILQSSLERLLGRHLLSYLFIVLTLAKPPMDNSSGIQGVHHCLPALTWPQDPQGVNRVRFAEKNGQDVKCF